MENTKTELFKTFNGTTEEELKATGTKILVDWEQLNGTIEKAVLLRPDEQISGFVINETGIMVSIRRKPGRKTNST